MNLVIFYIPPHVSPHKTGLITFLSMWSVKDHVSYLEPFGVETFLEIKVGLDFYLQPMSQLCAENSSVIRV